mmetsp:Transcript_15120/g.44136  ORF Transcript_15120/g.44136 Transcript_15120/m.44136 type:complete len:213 (+) Transcript_15120:394-1032(+)
MATSPSRTWPVMHFWSQATVRPRARSAARMVVPLVSLLPVKPWCSMDHPPHCMPKSSAPDPTSSTRQPFWRGRAPPLFLSSTSDLRAASRASARCSWQPTRGRSARRAKGSRKRPRRAFTRSTRATASSTRLMGMRPWSMAVRMQEKKLRWLWFPQATMPGSMTTSIPALMALTRASMYWPLGASSSTAAQSETRTPSNPISCFRTPVSSRS